MAGLCHDLPQDPGKLRIGDVGMLDVPRKDGAEPGNGRAGKAGSHVSSAATHFIGKIGEKIQAERGQTVVESICLSRDRWQPTGRNSMRKLSLFCVPGLRIAVFNRFRGSAPHLVSMSESSTTVLILAREELISALLGLFVESTGHTPIFAKVGEGIPEAVRRLRPSVVIVDCDHRDCKEDLMHAAKDVGARLILYSASREAEYVKKIAAPSHSQSFTFPIQPTELDSMIRRQAN